MIFLIGASGVAVRSNRFVMVISIALMLTAPVIAFISFSRWTLLPDGQAVAIVVTAVIVAIVATGLASVVKRDASGDAD